MRSMTLTLAALALGLAGPAAAQTKVAIGYSGWTGFAPLTLAKEAGIFKKHGLDVDLKKIPQKDRHLAIASGDVQCAATTVETWVVWNASGVPTDTTRAPPALSSVRRENEAGKKAEGLSILVMCASLSPPSSWRRA